MFYNAYGRFGVFRNGYEVFVSGACCYLWRRFGVGVWGCLDARRRGVGALRGVPEQFEALRVLCSLPFGLLEVAAGPVEWFLRVASLSKTSGHSLKRRLRIIRGALSPSEDRYRGVRSLCIEDGEKIMINTQIKALYRSGVKETEREGAPSFSPSRETQHIPLSLSREREIERSNALLHTSNDRERV